MKKGCYNLVPTQIYNTLMKLEPEQQYFKIPLPSLEGSKEYQEFKSILSRIDEILVSSGIENDAKRMAIEMESSKIDTILLRDDKLRIQKKAARSLRFNIALILCGESFREFSVRLADSYLLQRFCLLDGPNDLRMPSKSKLHRDKKYFSELQIRELVNKLLMTGTTQHEQLSLRENIDLETILFDSTCVPLNIHHPVDWLLLRDAARSIIKAVECIRKEGLKNRMSPPKGFMKTMNRLCMEMTHQRDRKTSKKNRKNILRKMKSHLKVVVSHGKRHRKLLNDKWHKTSLSEKKKDQILNRLNNILDEIDVITNQAHERIIGERQIKSHEKLLSLYEKEARVYKRGKAGKDVEFGLQLGLTESMNGLIIDWHLHKDQPLNDTRYVKMFVDRMEEKFPKQRIKYFVGDRGCASKKNDRFLKTNGIKNCLCSRNPKELKEKMKLKYFSSYQNRRSQTEGRIGIFKNKFLNETLKAKGYSNQSLYVSWAQLAHNLWVLARLPSSKELEKASA